MTADEFRKILDRFHTALTRADHWAQEHGAQVETEWHLELDAVWRNFNNHCALMKDAERQLIRLSPETLRQTPWSDHTAEEIGKLQAKVVELEGEANSREERLRKVECDIDVLGVGRPGKLSKDMERLVEAEKGDVSAPEPPCLCGMRGILCPRHSPC